jgi:hypothetical protein
MRKPKKSSKLKAKKNTCFDEFPCFQLFSMSVSDVSPQFHSVTRLAGGIPLAGV